MKIILDFKHVVTRQDIFDVFQKAFVFAYPPKGFDSLADSMASLDTESTVSIENHGDVIIEAKNLRHLKKMQPEGYEIVHKLLQST